MISMWSLGISVLVAFTLSSLINYVTSPLRGIPGPFLAGFTNVYRLIVVLRGNADKTHRQLHEKYGEYLRLGPNHVSISDLKMIGVIYDSKGQYRKSDFYAVADFVRGSEVVCTGFSTRDEKQHLEIVRPIAKLYTSTAVIEHEPRLDQAIDILVNAIERHASNDTSCPLDRLVYVFATNAMTLMTFSQMFDPTGQGQNIQSLVHKTFLATWYLAVVGQLPSLDRWLAKNPICYIGPPSTSTLAQLAAEILKERQPVGSRGALMSCPDYQPDFLDHFDRISTDFGVKVQWMMRNVAAGSDSTAISIISLVYLLCQSSDAMDILSNELEEQGVGQQIREGRQVKYNLLQDATKFPYLDAVLRENRRLHPPVALGMERVVPRGGFKHGDMFLPEGTIVSMNPAVVHYNPDLFGPDPNQFRPERWLPKAEEDHSTYTARIKCWDEAMLTFGRGKRRCPGNHLSDMEVRKCIVTLVARFSFDLEKGPSKHAYWFHYLKDLYVRVAVK
ncbi:hypothetical protein KVT40_001704 [Elsinoe batatas]|uniref:Cytochrome P450 n=1 Tax=Elsinoe batatas TaxID=2601811 RepID=A0A8K0L9P7_9PEZI|nr:hypothetical protein KVT40_001704 [Elsinoe batatas]